MQCELTFREATVEDALFIAWGFHTAMLYDDATQERIAGFANDVCVREDVLYSWRNTLLAIVEGRPVGMITSYEGERYHAMRERTMAIVKEKLGVAFPGMEDEAVPGEYYLDSLAVVPEYRGRGIGRALLQQGIGRGLALGLKVTLAVDPVNTRAQRLYASLGFKPAGELFIFGHTYWKMEILTLQQRLFAMQDKGYAAFQAKLTPGIPVESFIGVRVPLLRKFAKEFGKEASCEGFLQTLPHTYYDENMLHALLLSQMKDYDACIRAVDSFLPYVDNWAVCDIMSPKVFAKHRLLGCEVGGLKGPKGSKGLRGLRGSKGSKGLRGSKGLIEKIREWSASSHTYTCRFGLEMLMTHFLDADFRAEYLEIPARVRSEEYYVRMMVAWFYATALAKQWEATILYLEKCVLEPWTHNKTIQKACESYRITPEQKQYLRTLKAPSRQGSDPRGM